MDPSKIIKRHPVGRWFLPISIGATSISYLSILIPPNLFWPAIFVSYTIPLLLVWNLSLFILALPFNRKVSIVSFILLIIGLPFIFTAIKFNEAKAPNHKDLSILSYNAKLFRKRNTYSEFSPEMIAWAVADTSKIKCFQEYSTNSKWRVLDVTKQISEKGYHHFTFAAKMDDIRHNLGLAIFSKYNIIDSGYVWQDYGSINAGIYIDIKIKKDTVRIYNVHLASMYLKFKDSNSGLIGIKQFLSKIRHGSERRFYQIDKLISHATKSPHPYIICGDFNEIPYSYNYLTLKRYFNSAFDESGNGFGFTFNRFPKFLRIDHQFYCKQLNASAYYVDKSIEISDHFPTRGFYELPVNP